MADAQIRPIHRQGETMKFFKQNKTCTICHKSEPEVTIKKQVRHPLGKLIYCEECWNKTMEYARPQVMAQIKGAQESGKKIDIQDARNLSDKITKEINLDTH